MAMSNRAILTLLKSTYIIQLREEVSSYRKSVYLPSSGLSIVSLKWIFRWKENFVWNRKRIIKHDFMFFQYIKYCCSCIEKQWFLFQGNCWYSIFCYLTCIFIKLVNQIRSTSITNVGVLVLLLENGTAYINININPCSICPYLFYWCWFL